MIRRARREPRSAAKTPPKGAAEREAGIETVLAETMGERQAIFRLRYQAYVWEVFDSRKGFWKDEWPGANHDFFVTSSVALAH